MARAGLDLTVRELAAATGLDKATIVRFEAGMTGRKSTVEKIQGALEQKGAIFEYVEGGLSVTIRYDDTAGERLEECI